MCKDRVSTDAPSEEHRTQGVNGLMAQVGSMWSKRLLHASDPDHWVLDVLACAGDLFPADHVQFWWADADHTSLRLHAQATLSDPLACPDVDVPMGHGLVGWVGQACEPVWLTDAPSDYRHRSGAEQPFDAYPQWLGMPVVHRRRCFGVVALFARKDRRWAWEAIANLQTLMVQASEQAASWHAIVHATSGTPGSSDGQQASNHRMARCVGLPCGPGVALGTVVWVGAGQRLEQLPDDATHADTSSELARLDRAVSALRVQMQAWGEAASAQMASGEAKLFDAYLQLVDSAGLHSEIKQLIQERSLSVLSALKCVVMTYCERFEAMSDPILRTRAIDIRDVGQRLLEQLQRETPITPVYPEQTLLVGDEVPPSALLDVPEGCLKGVFSAKGSRFAHTSILARAMGVPVVMGYEGELPRPVHGQTAILDGYQGLLIVRPDAATLARFHDVQADEDHQQATMAQLTGAVAQTADGYSIKLQVNVGVGSDIVEALRGGADGVGLFRTEIPFLMRDAMPSFEAQKQIYTQLFRAFAPKPVTVRLLDVGGDKALAYLCPEEANPSLGWRGMRVMLDQTDVLRVQLRAILEANHGLGNARLLLPMVSHVHQVRALKRTLECVVHDIAHHQPEVVVPPLGVMLEVPSVLWMMEAFASEVDFFSVGSNDLVQYLLAVDRNNARVAHLYHHCHPSVLHALQHAVTIAHKHHTPINICGEMASDPTALLLCVAMGFDALSVMPKSLGRIKWLLRQFAIRDMRQWLHAAMDCREAHDVCSLILRAYADKGLERWFGVASA